MSLLVVFAMSCRILSTPLDMAFVDSPHAAIGTCGNDQIKIESHQRNLNALDGNDEIIDANEKDNILVGGHGNDTFYSGAGNDIYYGASGRDLFVFEGSFGEDTIADFNYARGDRIMLMLNFPEEMSFDSIVENYVEEFNGYLKFDFRNSRNFQHSVLWIKNMPKSSLTENRILIRHVDTN